jgi:hypothetical protein
MAKAGRQTVQVRAYATRIVIRLGDEVVAEHPRLFGRDQVHYDPWHYVPVLARKPGALRNGAPFIDWSLPPGLSALRKALGKGNDADRRFVRVLAQVPEEGLAAVEAAIREALEAGLGSDEVILNILSRRRLPPACAPASVLTNLQLAHPPWPIAAAMTWRGQCSGMRSSPSSSHADASAPDGARRHGRTTPMDYRDNRLQPPRGSIFNAD